MNRATVTPERAAHRTHPGASGALLLPELLAGTGDFVAGLDLVGTGALASQVMANGFIEQRFVDFGAKNRVRQFDFADLLIVEI